MSEKFLIIQTAFLGDVILTTPLIRQLSLSSPGCEIHFVTTPIAAEILKSLPGVFSYPYDKKNGGLIQGFLEIKKRLNEHQFKAVYCVHKSPRSLLLGAIVSADKKYSFDSVLAKILGYETVKYPPYDENIHYVDKVLKLVPDALSSKSKPWLQSSVEEKNIFQKKYPDLTKPYVVVSPYSAWGTKMWPEENYFKVVEKILQNTDYDIVLTGSAADANSSEKKNRNTNSRVKNLIGKTTVNDLKVLIENSKLLLANDSAPIHIAAAFNIPVVAVFGPTVKKWGFFPLSEKAIVCEVSTPLDCRPCSLHGPKTCPQGHFRCMKEVSVDQVWGSLSKLL